MAGPDVVNEIVSATVGYLSYMLPIIGVLAGITFVASFLYYLFFHFGDRTFRS